MGFENLESSEDRHTQDHTNTNTTTSSTSASAFASTSTLTSIDQSNSKAKDIQKSLSLQLDGNIDVVLDDDDLTTIEIDTNWLKEGEEDDDIETEQRSPLASPFTSSRPTHSGPRPVVENGITASTVSSFKLICTSDLDLPIPNSFRLSQKRAYIAYRSFFLLYWLVFVASMEVVVYADKAYHGAFLSGDATDENGITNLAYRLSPSYCTTYLVFLYSFLTMMVSLKPTCSFCNYFTGYIHNLATVFSIFLTTIYWISVVVGIQENIGNSLNHATSFMIVNFYGINALFMVTELTICKYPIPKQRMWLSMLISAVYLLSVLFYEKFSKDKPIHEYFSVEKPITSFLLGTVMIFLMLPLIHYICERYEMYFYGVYVRAEYKRARNFTLDRNSVERPERQKYLSSRRLSIEALLADLDDLDIEEEEGFQDGNEGQVQLAATHV